MWPCAEALGRPDAVGLPTDAVSYTKTSALTHEFIAGHPLGRRAQGGGSDTTQRKGLSWVVYGKMHADFKALFLRKLP